MEKKEYPKRISHIKISMVKEGTGVYNTNQIKDPKDVSDIMSKYMEGLDREIFTVLLLNTKNQVTGIETIAIGSLNLTIVHPREVFKAAIIGNANAIILCHNHPSGDCEPSRLDIELTQRLKEAGKILCIPVVDHVIIGGFGTYHSII